jgi:hypothetical protein
MCVFQMYVWQNIYSFPRKGIIFSCMILLLQSLKNILYAVYAKISCLTVYFSTRREAEMEKAKVEVKTWNLDLG